MLIKFIFLIIILTFFSQIIVWRLFKPKNTGKSLLFVLLLFNLFYYFLFRSYFIFDEFGNDITLLIFLAILSFDFMYIFGFPPVEHPSPSVELIDNIRKNKSLNIKKYIKKKEKKNIIKIKIQQLINEKYLVRERSYYKLTKKGKILVKVFSIYKSLIKQGLGG